MFHTTCDLCGKEIDREHERESMSLEIRGKDGVTTDRTDMHKDCFVFIRAELIQVLTPLKTSGVRQDLIASILAEHRVMTSEQVRSALDELATVSEGLTAVARRLILHD